jgi:ketosteroid isomerase-like protein
MGGDWEIAADLTQLMAEIDSGFFDVADRDVAERYWSEYIAPEIARLFADDVAFHSHFEGPNGRRVYMGHDGLRVWADDVFETFSAFRRHNSDWQPLGDDALIMHQRIEATGRNSGADIELRLWVLWLIEDGRVAEFRTFADRYEAEAAAGSARLASGPPGRAT